MPDPGTNTPAWYEGIAPDVLGHVQNKGWDLSDPKVTLAAAVQQARAAEQHIGVPADQILRLPKDANDVAGLDAMWQRLGAPKDAKEYKFDDVKFKDGSPLDDGVSEKFRAFAAANRLPAATANAFAKFIAQLADEDAAASATETATSRGAQDAVLRQQWGAEYDVNTFLANKAAEAAGLPADVIELAKSTAAGMVALRNLGAKMGEATLLQGGQAPGGTAGMTKEQAQDRINTLRNDSAWIARWAKGDAAAAKELDDLHRILLPAPKA